MGPIGPLFSHLDTSMGAQSVSKTLYRSDIDGLRALAVLSVVFFHIGVERFSGGYIGVDVFFVISGFLISRLIRQEVEDTGRFDFSRFYLRRALRLLPALFFTLTLTLGLACLLFSPQDLPRVGTAVAHASVGLSNFFFWGEVGYFDSDALFKPVLHTWSLGVEEQFYLLWPVALVFFLTRRSRTVAPVMILLGGLFSLGLNLFFSDGDIPSLARLSPSAANWFEDGESTIYYLAPFRVFEFALGAGVVWLADLRPKNRLLLEALVLGGLGMVAFPLFTYTTQTLFPTYNALLPCIGTALVIYAGPTPLIGRALGHRWAVKIGLLSYSLYLIHWPVLVFWRYQQPEFDNLDRGLVCLFSLAAAAGMTRFVERPFRTNATGPPRMSQRAVVLGAAVFALSGVVAGGLVGAGQLPVEARSLEGFNQCGDIGLSLGSSCTVRKRGPKKLVVWGDSHASVLVVGGVPPQLSDYTIYVITLGGCPPVVDVIRDDGEGTGRNCKSLETVRHNADVILGLEPEAVFIVARWSVYNQGSYKGLDLQSSTHFLSVDPARRHDSKSLSREIFERQLEVTLNHLEPVKAVLLFKAVPEIPNFMQVVEVSPHEVPSFPREAHDSWQRSANEAIDRVVAGTKVEVVDLAEVFCDETRCRLDGQVETGEKGSFYLDDNHVNVLGSRMIWEQIGEDVARKVRRR